jgi:hypothetical protein
VSTPLPAPKSITRFPTPLESVTAPKVSVSLPGQLPGRFINSEQLRNQLHGNRLAFSESPIQKALFRKPLDNREIGEIARVASYLHDPIGAGGEAGAGIVEGNEGAQPRSRPKAESSSTIGSESGGCQQARDLG